MVFWDTLVSCHHMSDVSQGTDFDYLGLSHVGAMLTPYLFGNSSAIQLHRDNTSRVILPG